MLLVPTKNGPSKIHGIGLFAAKPIKKGTVVWRFTPEIDIVMTPAVLKQLSPVAREQVMTYAYQDKQSKEIILCGDDARFFNHSDNANVIDNPNNSKECLAARDIPAGEELTCDYKAFDLLAKRHLGRCKS